ncbi:CRISPR-associated protein Cas4 [Tahibacter amnicola]|uniref:CRISPR-associated exonuclease Cas4 n=1 Tax=Tahibacter amnicola TaxID=2976241 RepID=A0ABY6BDJ4_9GAMM|nr:CRISPR-associated protein Cas4 [Tahibacter amnicola]UXI67303.1 CRISPR-associated protein Cas4 [Tahibacter amnicola]
MDSEEIIIPISALQHYLYCPRQCALIHVERLWAENVHTAEGRLLHDRSDRPRTEARHGVRTATALAIGSDGLGLVGVADVVEFVGDDGLQPFPVEYKRGSPKSHRADEVQLCAQALCLEEMLGTPVPEGALFYGKTRRRVVVRFDAGLRALTLEVINLVRALIQNQTTPTADYMASRCDSCSLLDLCRPRRSPGRESVKEWLRRALGDDSS